MSARADEMAATRRRAETVSRLRRLAKAAPAAGRVGPTGEVCDLCGTEVPEDHRHLLGLEDRRILCSCEACWAMKSGDPGLAPTGTRTVWLEDIGLDDELWGRFAIPIGLAFMMRSSTTGGVVALYPSPAGATESELDMDAWDELVAGAPVLADLAEDGEALVVDRMGDTRAQAIVPIDRAYELVGRVKLAWSGIGGGTAVEETVAEFFAAVRERAGAAAGG